jgi:hypothetical protein
MSDNPTGNPQNGNDFAPQEAELSLVSNLSVGSSEPGSLTAQELTEQGNPPADLAERSAPHVPAPSRDGLSAAEVAHMTGQDESTVNANNALDRAEGVIPDDED